jgi:hypothetical protein
MWLAPLSRRPLSQAREMMHNAPPLLDGYQHSPEAHPPLLAPRVPDRTIPDR